MSRDLGVTHDEPCDPVTDRRTGAAVTPEDPELERDINLVRAVAPMVGASDEDVELRIAEVRRWHPYKHGVAICLQCGLGTYGNSAPVCTACGACHICANKRNVFWHCPTCHEFGHHACAGCGKCMKHPHRRWGGHRSDRYHCSSACRQRAYRRRRAENYSVANKRPKYRLNLQVAA